MTIAAVGAVALGQVEEAALLGHPVLDRGRPGALRRHADPARAARTAGAGAAHGHRAARRAGRSQVAPDELVVGDVMLLRPGRAGRHGRSASASGRTSLDVSAITGESVPVEAGAGRSGARRRDQRRRRDRGRGHRARRRTARWRGSCTSSRRPRNARAPASASRTGSPARSSPAIMVLAALIAGLGALLGDPLLWLERALVVLVAASPCALAIAVPLSVVAAIGAASRHGRAGQGRRRAGGARPDPRRRTGQDRHADPQRSRRSSRSSGRPPEPRERTCWPRRPRWRHAASTRSPGRSWPPPVTARAPPTTSTAVAGHGLTGTLRRRPRCGWASPAGSSPARSAGDVERLQGDGATVVLVERDGALLGAIAVRDELRPEAREAVRRLRRPRHRRSPCSPATTGAPPTRSPPQAGITTVHAELLPGGQGRPARRASPAAGGSPWSATASTTPPRWPPPTSASPWAPWAPTWRSRPPTSR